MSVRHTSSYHDVRVALVDGLSALGSLAGVTVSSADLGSKRPVETIELLDGDITQQWAALGRFAKDETAEFDLGIWITKPGAGEDVIRAARSRAFELLGIVESYLLGDPSIAGAARAAALSNGQVHEGAVDNKRYCALVMHVTSPLVRITPSA